MVHLAAVPNDGNVKSLANLDINDPEDDPSVSVYGSHFAAECLPTHAMPEKQMPKEIAYRMVGYPPSSTLTLADPSMVLSVTTPCVSADERNHL